MNYEQLGVFYLGREVDAATMEEKEQLLLYDSSDMTTHAVIVGMTGSGKTGLGVGLIEEAAIDGIPVLAIDPKGDLGNLALTFPELRGQDFAPWVDPREAEQKGMSTAEYGQQQADLWRKGLADWHQEPSRIQRFRDAAEVAVYTPGSSAGRPISVLRSFAAPPAAVLADSDLFNERLTTTASSLLTLVGADTDPLGREHILLTSILEHAWRESRDVDLVELVQAIQQPPLKKLGVMDIDTVFPAKERLKFAMAINAVMAAPTFAAWTQGEPLDVQQLLYDPNGRARVAVVTLAHLSDSERDFFMSLLLNEVVSWTRSQTGTSSLRAMVYIDELFGFLPPVSEPPTKKPLLTLLKQARAFGVGLTLATQNPVDIDYKALSNAGTWFIGRLQTERDKKRLVDGLTAAAPGSSNVNDLNDIIGRLGKRTFLLHNVHEAHPAVFRTRWVLSYLAGPMSRDQIRLLSQPTGAPPLHTDTASNTNTAALATSESAPAVATAAPFINGDVPQLFVPAQRTGEHVSYFPQVLAAADVHYSNKTHDVNEDLRHLRLAELNEGIVALDWNESDKLHIELDALHRNATPGITFQALPDITLDAKACKQWSTLFQRWLRTDGALIRYRFAPLKLVSQQGESEQAFRLRCTQILREQRDVEKEKIRKKYNSKLQTLERRRLSREQALESRAQKAQSSQMDALVTMGSTILGAFMNKRSPSSSSIGTAVRRGSRVNQSRGDVARAREALAQTNEEIAALERALQAELDQLASQRAHAEELALNEVSIKPTIRDIAIRFVGIAWVPYVQNSKGYWEESF